MASFGLHFLFYTVAVEIFLTILCGYVIIYFLIYLHNATWKTTYNFEHSIVFMALIAGKAHLIFLAREVNRYRLESLYNHINYSKKRILEC